jgi:hypothetical protein
LHISKKNGRQWKFTLVSGFSEGCPICGPFSTVFQSAVSNRFSDVQKVFSVIRDSSSNIMYTIGKKISYTKCKKKCKIAQLVGEFKTSAMFFGAIFKKKDNWPVRRIK